MGPVRRGSQIGSCGGTAPGRPDSGSTGGLLAHLCGLFSVRKVWTRAVPILGPYLGQRAASAQQTPGTWCLVSPAPAVWPASLQLPSPLPLPAPTWAVQRTPPLVSPTPLRAILPGASPTPNGAPSASVLPLQQALSLPLPPVQCQPLAGGVVLFLPLDLVSTAFRCSLSSASVPTASSQSLRSITKPLEELRPDVPPAYPWQGKAPKTPGVGSGHRSQSLEETLLLPTHLGSMAEWDGEGDSAPEGGGYSGGGGDC